MPVRLALLGRLQCSLPRARTAILLLQIDMAGFVDFGSGDIAVDATLDRLTVVTFPITGDFSIRANVGSGPTSRCRREAFTRASRRRRASRRWSGWASR